MIPPASAAETSAIAPPTGRAPGLIRILVVEDRVIFRIGLLTTLSLAPLMEVVAEASTGRQAVDCYRQYRPDIVLVDLQLPDMSGLALAAALAGEFAKVKVILLSPFEAADRMAEAFSVGVRGYLLKDASGDELLLAIRRVQAGGTHVPAGFAAPPGAGVFPAPAPASLPVRVVVP